MTPIKIYGTEWCEDTQHTREHLESLAIPYEYIDIERDERAARWVREQNHGKQITPTVKVQGLIFAEPSNQQLDEALRSHGIMA